MRILCLEAFHPKSAIGCGAWSGEDVEEVGDSVDFVVGVFFGGLGEAVFLSAVAEAGGGHVEAAGGCDFGVEFVAYGEDLPGRRARRAAARRRAASLRGC